MPAIAHLDALGPTGPFRSSRTEAVSGVDGAALAELSLVPALYVKRTIAKMRASRPLPVPERLAALAAAGASFRKTVDGVSFDDYENQVSRSSGVARTVVRSASRAIAPSAAAAGEVVRLARPG
ncbi:MAG: aldehyde dehydrogenase, partial [Nocardiopsaceae bacterium]|nr:aldehyde dehydrogenase [Nocardiopsaceae bacterium]